ncbi:MAG: hypothetical protein HY465_04740 [Deltaproteobacteria bacterium]|nr:hypothetical protein [Deltaproteobacteria bacterium]
MRKWFPCIVSAAGLAIGCAYAGLDTVSSDGSLSAPGKTTGVETNTGGGEIIVTFDAVSDATSYNLYCKVGTGVTTANATTAQTSITSPYTLSSLTNGTQYCCGVVAVNATGSGDLSDEACATPDMLGEKESFSTPSDALASLVDGALVFDNMSGGNFADVFDALGVSSTKVYMTGTSFGAGANYDMVLVCRMQSDGSACTDFGGGDGLVTYDGGFGDDGGFGIDIDDNENIFVGGYVTNAAGNTDMAIWEYDSSGSPVASFSGDGLFTRANLGGGNGDDDCFAIVVDGDGNIICQGRSLDAGGGFDYAIVGVTASGAESSASSGNVPTAECGNDATTAAKLDSQGRLWYAGYLAASCGDPVDLFDAFIARAVPDDTEVYADDTSCDGDGFYPIGADEVEDKALAIAIDSNDDAFVGGYTVGDGGDRDFRIFKISEACTTDTGYGVLELDRSGGNDEVWAMTIDSNDRPLIVGYQGTISDMVLCRLQSTTASLDTTFGTDGCVTYDRSSNADEGHAMVYTGGKVFVGGQTTGDDLDATLVKFK